MVVIEFFGMSRAGKTTHINNLASHLDSIEKSYLISSRPKVKFNEMRGLEHFHEIYLEKIVLAHTVYVQKNYDFLIYDRGPYDRQVLLGLDYSEGNVSSRFLEKMDELLKERSKTVNQGLLFLISPEESIRRLPEQRIKGLDNSHLNEGLPTFDANINRMELVHKKYLEMAQTNPKIKMIKSTDSKEEIFSKVLNVLSQYSI